MHFHGVRSSMTKSAVRTIMTSVIEIRSHYSRNTFNGNIMVITVKNLDRFFIFRFRYRRRYIARLTSSSHPNTITDILFKFSKIPTSDNEVGKLIPSQLSFSACFRRFFLSISALSFLPTGFKYLVIAPLAIIYVYDTVPNTN